MMKISNFLAQSDVRNLLSPSQIEELGPMLKKAFGEAVEEVAPIEIPSTGMRTRIWCDGSCIGNPGPGGWAVAIPGRGVCRGNDGGVETTNNRMEIRAAIQALKLTPGMAVEIITDSNLVVSTMNAGWKTNKNKDLWDELKSLAKGRDIVWTWVRGHGDDEMNNLVDRHAQEIARAPGISGDEWKA